MAFSSTIQGRENTPHGRRQWGTWTAGGAGTGNIATELFEVGGAIISGIGAASAYITSDPAGGTVIPVTCGGASGGFWEAWTPPQ